MFKITIDGAEDQDYEDKSIAEVTLNSVTSTSLSLSISFSEPSSISSDIKEPDILLIEFLLTDLIVDAETFEPIEIKNPVFSLTVGV